MQKFGLERHASGQPNAIELELAKEKATSLGRAGRKLELSLENYNNLLAKNLSEDEESRLISEISSNVWELMLQREFVGFVEGNLQWIRDNYVIPERVIKLMGS